MVPSRRVELALWIAIAVASLIPSWVQPISVVGDGVDAFGTWWFFWWIRTCVEHLGDPSFTNLFFFPDGKDVFAHTGNNFVDAVLAVPFAWVFGRAYFPFFVAFVLVGNAFAFRVLADEVFGRDAAGEGESDRRFAPFAATLLWTVNPFALFELTAGRPTQAFLWFLPVAVALFLRSARTGALRDGVLLGVATALTAWSYWFNGFFLALAFAVLTPFLLRAAPALPMGARGPSGSANQSDGRRTLLVWALGAAVCGLIVAPAVLRMAGAAEAGEVIGLLRSGGEGGVPSADPKDAADRVFGLWPMETMGAPQFLQPAWGLGALAAMLLPGVRLPGGRARWVALLLAAVVFALGPAITEDGEVLVRLPWYRFVQDHVPFLDRLWFPYRLVVIALLSASLLIGALCARLPRPRLALAGLVTLSVAGQGLCGIWPLNTHDARVPPMVASLREEGGGVLFLPFRLQHDGLIWQTEFQLPTFGGMGESAPVFWPKPFAKRLSNPFVKALRGAMMLPPVTTPFRPEDRAQLEKHGFRWVIVRPSLVQGEHARQADMRKHDDIDTAVSVPAAVDLVAGSIGRGPDGIDGDAIVWDLRGSWKPRSEWAATPERLTMAAARTSTTRARYESGLLATWRNRSGK